MLRIEGLDVSIQSVSILRGISMDVPTGKFAGLIGRNGAGKTTLMRSVMGILPARRGTIRFDEVALDRMPAHQRARGGIGYMPEDRRLVPQLSVEENVLIPAWAAGIAEPAARVSPVTYLRTSASLRTTPGSPSAMIRPS